MIDPPNALLWLILRELFDLKPKKKIRDVFFEKAGLRTAIDALYFCQVLDDRLSFQFHLGMARNYFVASEELSADISETLYDIKYATRPVKKFLAQKDLDPKLKQAVQRVKQLINDPLPGLEKHKSINFLSLVHWLSCVSKYDQQKIKRHLHQYDWRQLPLLSQAKKKLDDHQIPWRFE